MKKDYSNCDKCQNKDWEKSNTNWNVCPVMPLDAVMNGSANCSKFVAEYPLRNSAEPKPLT